MNNKKSINVLSSLPPQDIDAEKSVLGSILLDQKSLIKVSDLIIKEDFYDQKHSIIYNAILALFEKRSPIDILTLSSYLDDKKELEIIGGRSYISELINSVPTSTNILRYAQIVKEKSILRKLIFVGDELKVWVMMKVVHWLKI
jgi:replicative DNA helicase